ncbi:hypothetical protein [Chelatococcus asaccharovorans]|uniref:hypothetical protein n=1 Tax=Chelatococcus asaccharovorans TaxID=28210 RepID=UPI00224C7B56|nr:hypothetical protein [Chelatococcus asaccharovorans]CAH1652803.1 hypothetical protein CHELA40_10704 [Chelatococcus asaccharovorans]CAH1686229.1 hypothetical protein CHELA17_64902 [Chelatococcus asaccharovorans]
MKQPKREFGETVAIGIRKPLRAALCSGHFLARAKIDPVDHIVIHPRREVRVWRDVLADGISCGLKRIERLMRVTTRGASPHETVGWKRDKSMALDGASPAGFW